MKSLIIIILITIFHDVKATNFPKIYGCFCEGGIITGKISENSTLRIDDQKVLTYNNRFIFAFGRKFKDTVENSIKSQLEYPDSIKSIMDREKSAKTMKSYSELKEYLMHKD